MGWAEVNWTKPIEEIISSPKIITEYSVVYTHILKTPALAFPFVQANSLLPRNTQKRALRKQREAKSAMDGEDGTQTQQLILANKIFLLTHPDVDDLQKVRLRDEVFNAVVANGILSCFDWLWSLLDFTV